MSRFSRAKRIHTATIEGRRAVLETIRSGSRITKLIIYDGMEMKPQLEEILFLAKKGSITVERVTKKQLESQAHTKKHQGIIAVVPDPVYSTVDDIISFASKRSEPPLLVMLDGIQDPHNFGAISRTIEASGFHGIIIPSRRSASISPGAVRASAGALGHVLVARVVNLTRTLVDLKLKGLSVVGLDGDSDMDYRSYDFKRPTIIVAGSEENGLSRLVGEQCDYLISIPMKGQIESLNVSVSTGIVLYHALSERSQ